MRYLIYILLLLPLLASAQSKKQNYKVVHAEQFSYLIDSCINKKIIDVRIQEEFNNFRIHNAINLPSKSELTNFTKTLDKETYLFIYCTEGVRSTTAAKLLQTKGFINIITLEWGIIEWKEANKPIDNTAKTKRRINLN